MEPKTEARAEPRWVTPLLIAAVAILTVLTLTTWIQLTFGGLPEAVNSGNHMGAMMGTNMMNVADDGKGAGNQTMPCGQDMEKMHQKMGKDADHDKLHEACEGKAKTDAKNT